MKRDPRTDPRPGDRLSIGHIVREVFAAPPRAEWVTFYVPRFHIARTIGRAQWIRSMKKATVLAIAGPEEPPPEVVAQGEMFEA